jgi:protein-L-isoaspartate(D-aspartate) O-methyltransferase
VSQALSRQLATMGIRDERVLRAVAEVPRHLFVPAPLQREAEADRPLPIGHGQTISQPFIVAYMTEALRLAGGERVLEVGTGSGYQTAILALLAREVCSVEIVPELADTAARLLLGTLALRNVRLRVADGRLGWPEAAPFDRILATAAPAQIPPALLEQLAPGGRLVIPVGADPEVQHLQLVVRGEDGITTTTHLLPVRFVPLTGGGPGSP